MKLLYFKNVERPIEISSKDAGEIHLTLLKVKSEENAFLHILNGNIYSLLEIRALVNKEENESSKKKIKRSNKKS